LFLHQHPSIIIHHHHHHHHHHHLHHHQSIYLPTHFYPIQFSEVRDVQNGWLPRTGIKKGWHTPFCNVELFMMGTTVFA
jgi:hypothetical protein